MRVGMDQTVVRINLGKSPFQNWTLIYGESSSSMRELSFPSSTGPVLKSARLWSLSVKLILMFMSHVQDAAWMVPGEPLKCQSPADVYLLLKSSDFISHDLDHAFDLCIDTPLVANSEVEPAEVTTLPAEESLVASTSRLELADDDESNQSSSEDEELPPKKRIKRDYDFELVLKKWFDMPKSQEWRCFVRNKELLGTLHFFSIKFCLLTLDEIPAITHRDVNYYKFLQPAEVTDDLRSKILDFFLDQVLDNFPSDSCE